MEAILYKAKLIFEPNKLAAVKKETYAVWKPFIILEPTGRIL